MRAILIALLGALTVASCSKKDHSPASAALDRTVATADPAAAGSAAAGARSTTPAPAAQPADHRKVIRTGRVELVVASYDAARSRIDALVSGTGGYVDSTRVSRQRGAVSAATLVVRIPSDAFGSMLPRLGQIGELTSEVTDAADITSQYVDTEARLASAQMLEKRLLEFATTRSGTMDQVLAIERELARVRGDIEGYQGHLRQWSDQVALSTLTIELTTRSAELAEPERPSLGSQSSSALRTSLTALSAVASGLAITMIALLPWLLVAAPLYLGLRTIVRRARSRLPRAIARPSAAPGSQDPPS